MTAGNSSLQMIDKLLIDIQTSQIILSIDKVLSEIDTSLTTDTGLNMNEFGSLIYEKKELDNVDTVMEIADGGYLGIRISMFF